MLELWPIDVLGERVKSALGEGYSGVANGRVRDVPDARTIRYYTTLGLLDRPSGWRGRTALYGKRHLLQIVAIKRLQARGLSLAEIQRRLPGLSDEALEAVALAANAPSEESQTAVADRAATPFWRAKARELSASAPRVQAIRLADGATLVLDSPRPLDDADRRLVRMATAPLLALLRLHGLLVEPNASPSTGDPADDHPPRSVPR